MTFSFSKQWPMVRFEADDALASTAAKAAQDDRVKECSFARPTVRKQKTDRQDAELILKLMLKDDFPQIWYPRLNIVRPKLVVLSSSRMANDGTNRHT
jgi:hypothetical protein